MDHQVLAEFMPTTWVQMWLPNELFRQTTIERPRTPATKVRKVRVLREQFSLWEPPPEVVPATVRPDVARPRSMFPGHPLRARERAFKAESDRIHAKWADQRPTTRGDCVDGIRPCPWASCKFHLAIKVNDHGSVKIMFPDDEGGVALDRMEATCVLDVAELSDGVGGLSDLQVGRYTRESEEWVRLARLSGLERLAGKAEELGIDVPAGRLRR